jgi:hypothetical protein
MSLVAKFKKQDDDMEALFSVMEFSIKEHLLEKLSPSKTAMKKEAKAQALAKAKA